MEIEERWKPGSSNPFQSFYNITGREDYSSGSAARSFSSHGTGRRTGGWKFEEFVKDMAVSNVVIAVPFFRLQAGFKVYITED